MSALDTSTLAFHPPEECHKEHVPQESGPIHFFRILLRHIANNKHVPQECCCPHLRDFISRKNLELQACNLPHIPLAATGLVAPKKISISTFVPAGRKAFFLVASNHLVDLHLIHKEGSSLDDLVCSHDFLSHDTNFVSGLTLRI